VYGCVGLRCAGKQMCGCVSLRCARKQVNKCVGLRCADKQVCGCVVLRCAGAQVYGCVGLTCAGEEVYGCVGLRCAGEEVCGCVSLRCAGVVTHRPRLTALHSTSTSTSLGLLYNIRRHTESLMDPQRGIISPAGSAAEFPLQTLLMHTGHTGHI